MVDRKKVLQNLRVNKKVVHVEEWGGDVLVKGVVLNDMMLAIKLGDDFVKNDPEAIRGIVKFVLERALDPETEKPIFDKGDLDLFMESYSDVFNFLYGEIMDISGASSGTGDVLEKN